MFTPTPTIKMTPQTKARTERELEVAKMNVRDLRSSNKLLSQQLDDKNFELLAKDREIEQLKISIARRDANLFESTCDEPVAHTHPGRQRTSQQSIGYNNPRQRRDTDTKRRNPRVSPEKDRHLKVLQKTLKNTEMEKEALQRSCLERDSRIHELEAELTRVLHENEVQHSRLEDCLEEKASISERYDRLTKSYEKLQTESLKGAGFKRSLAMYLSDVEFSQDDFLADGEQQRFTTPIPKDNLGDGNTSHSHTATPSKYCATVSEVRQPGTPSLRMAPSTTNIELTHKRDNLPSEIDDNTIVVDRRVKEGRADSTSQIIQSSTEAVPQDMYIAEDKQIDVDDGEDDNGDDEGGDDDDETTSDSETDAASEYDPTMDREGEPESDGDLTFVEDSDYAL